MVLFDAAMAVVPTMQPASAMNKMDTRMTHIREVVTF